MLEQERLATTGHTLPDQIWIAEWNGRATTRTSYVGDDGWRQDRVHQYRGDHKATYGGISLHIDSNFMDVGRGTRPGKAAPHCKVQVDFPTYPRRARGDRGEHVKAAQCFLRQQGHYDGMLHGLNADTGAEMWAYVPQIVVPSLYQLASIPYNHRYFVDGSPTVGDICVDAVDGPMPQTRFVTQKAFLRGFTPLVVINKIDRDGARPGWVLDQTFDLFDRLGATEEQLDFPVVYTSALQGYASLAPDARDGDMTPLFESIVTHVAPPQVDLEATHESALQVVRLEDLQQYASVKD